MDVKIGPYRPEDVKAVAQFNGRLATRGAYSNFPESHVSEWLPPFEGRDIYMDYFLAKDGNDVRGGYILKHQAFSIKGKTLDLPLYKLPVSEGIVDRKYVTVGIQLLMDALRKHPLLFTLGIGGYSEPVARMLKKSQWAMYSVPFYFKILHPYGFLRNISFLRRNRIAAITLDVLTFTGIGLLGLYALKYLLGIRRVVEPAVACELFDEYDDWADKLWGRSVDSYLLAAVRDSQTLNILYPPHSDRFVKLLVTENDVIIGWVVVLDTHMKGHRQFGNMRVGSIVDSLARPSDAAKVISAASDYLEARGVDVVVANYSHREWCRAFRKCGFLRGPSNFIFAASKKLAEWLQPFDVNKTRLYLNRGDGDGPINL